MIKIIYKNIPFCRPALVWRFLTYVYLMIIFGAFNYPGHLLSWSSIGVMFTISSDRVYTQLSTLQSPFS